MSFTNKRILVVCRECFASPFYYLAKEWKENNEVAFFFPKPSETTLKENYSNKYTYYTFKKLEGVKTYDTNEIVEQHTLSLKEDRVIDPEYLNYIEENYTHYANIGIQLMSSQSLTRPYHFRYFWRACKYSEQINWLILNYKLVEKMLDEFNPDLIVNSDNEELGRCVLREVAHRRDIPNICVEYPRYENYMMHTFNLGLCIDKGFLKAYENALSKPEEELKDELNYVRDFRTKNNIMNNIWRNDITSKYKPDTVTKDFYHFVRILWLFFKQDIINGNYWVKNKNYVLNPNTWGYIKYFLYFYIRKAILMRKNSIFKTPVEGQKYLYMPLHLIPESTTFVLSPMYVNELTIIEAISKSLPAGWMLYVKEHQAMVGERSLDFYKKVNRLSNVKMVQLNYYSDPKPWIVKSHGVVTISGTTAYEAVMLGKNAVVFSDVPFSLIEGVHRVKSFEDLPKVLRCFTHPLDNVRSCASYVQAVKFTGVKSDFINLCYGCDHAIRNDIEPQGELKEWLRSLDKLFTEAYSNFKKNVV